MLYSIDVIKPSVIRIYLLLQFRCLASERKMLAGRRLSLFERVRHLASFCGNHRFMLKSIPCLDS